MIIDKRSDDRRGGHTYNGLLVIIQQCLAFPDKKAAVMFDRDEAARHGMRMAFEMITPLLGDGFAQLFHQRRIIQFKNGSEIHFITPSTVENRMRGMKSQIGMIDNSIGAEADYAVRLLRAMVRD